MARKIHGSNSKIKVSPEVYAVATLARQRFQTEPKHPAYGLAVKIMRSRTITRRMWDSIKGAMA